jgi:hypothetical protein
VILRAASLRRALMCALCALCAWCGIAPSARCQAVSPQGMVGVETAHPRAVKTPARMQALGLVLDTSALITDAGEVAVAEAGERSSTAEVTRLQALYSGGAGASRKMLEAAQADQVRAHAQSASAAAHFNLRWGPVAALAADARRKLFDFAANGMGLLVRADVPGRHSLGAAPDSALLDVDGIQVSGRVLGILRQSGEVQSVGVLIEVEHAPPGLGPGARIPVVLLAAPRDGMLLPRDALLYDENGAYVFKQLSKKTGDEKPRYAAVKVKLLLAEGEGWLVSGVDDDDEIVVHGAGMLWSLQGVGTATADDDDD